MTTTATARNRETYNRIWRELMPFFRYIPGARHRRRILFQFVAALPKRSVLDVGRGNSVRGAEEFDSASRDRFRQQALLTGLWIGIGLAVGLRR